MTLDDTRIKLGMKVRDKITGLEGTAIGYTYWMYGCERITIQPSGVKDGKPHDAYTVDEPQCEIIDAKPAAKAKPTHGPRDDAPRRSDPR